MSAETAETPQFRFRFFPVLVTVVLGFGIPYIAAEILDQLRHYSRLVPGIADQLGRLYAQHAVLMLLASSTIYWHNGHALAAPTIATDSTPSLAVLPFENLGAKEEGTF